RLDEFCRDRSRRAVEARRMAARWVDLVGGAKADTTTLNPGAVLGLAYPDRIAKNRGDGRFLLANGRGAAVDQTSRLAREPFLAVAEIAGSATQGRIVLAAPISLAEIEKHFVDGIEARQQITFEQQAMALRARASRALGAIVLTERPVPIAADETSARILAD